MELLNWLKMGNKDKQKETVTPSRTVQEKPTKEKPMNEAHKDFISTKRKAAKDRYNNQKHPNEFNIAPKSAPKKGEKKAHENKAHEEVMKAAREQAVYDFRGNDFPNQFGIAPKKVRTKN